LLTIQPSEAAKSALVKHLGVMLADKREYLNDFKFAVLPMLIWIGIVAALVALQPNLSTALVISTLGFGVLFMGRVKLWHLAAVTLPALAGAGLYAISAEYRMRRIMGFIGMHSGESSGIETAGYQLKQGLLAFGSGGLFGVGPGQSHQRLFVPEPFGDFIYSIIGEEYGFAGTTFLMLVFGVIIWRGLLVARQAPDDLGRNVAAGITMAVGLYAIVNAGVTTGLLPTTGLPMPFVSYGGSSVLFSAAAVGVLLNISRHANVMPYRREQPKVVEGVVA
ncbi:MAG: FtsW/RodA/SpoVE family cell cycle protein, partial [Candidatus Kapaibacterium sp.]